MKKVLGGASLAAVVAAVGLVGGYWHFADLLPEHEQSRTGEVEPASANDAGAIQPSAPADRVENASQIATSEELPDPSDVAAAADLDPRAPSVDLLRVEPDGSAVVAGRAEPMSEIVIRNAGAIVARDRAGATGDFVATLDQPLAVGDHELSVEVIAPDGSVRTARDVAIISVPPRGREQELLVALGAPNAPTRLLAVPAGAPQGGEALSPDTAATAASSGTPAIPGTAEAIPAAPPQLADTQANAALAPGSDLSVAAVEIEGDTLYIAGTARPGTSVRIYLDDAFIAQAEGREGGQFIAESITRVPVGAHVVRIDQLSPDGSVAARVAVPFDRPEGTSMAALAPQAGGVPGSSVPGMPSAPVELAGTTAGLRGSILPTQASERDASGLSQMQAALEPVSGRVIIRRGDTLWRISRETYGLGSRYTVIYLANGDQIRDPDRIYPGQIFRLPDEEANETRIQ